MASPNFSHCFESIIGVRTVPAELKKVIKETGRVQQTEKKQTNDKERKKTQVVNCPFDFRQRQRHATDYQ